MMDRYTKNALCEYWRRGDDEEVITDSELFNPRDNSLIEKNEIARMFRIDTGIFCFKTTLCEAFREFNYLSQINIDVRTKDIPGFKAYKEHKNRCIYKWNKVVPWVANMLWVDYGLWMEPNDDAEHSVNREDDVDISDFEDYLIQKDPPYYVNEEEKRSKDRRCKLLGIPYVKPPTCKSEKFEVVKYSFGPSEEYFAIKE
uniref:Uncharacterized protein n=1 Tax=Tanacetum cinerariifolium TaxID=118510 RepID=A0A699H0K4_TANCI|nr:hypothetical protein [Tanacetum cinerariifolium]